MVEFNPEGLPPDEFDDDLYNSLTSDIPEQPYYPDDPYDPDELDDPDDLDDPCYNDRREKIKSFYKYLEDNGYEVDITAPLRHEARFEINTDKELTVKYANETFSLIHEKIPNLFLSPSELIARNGEPFVEAVLGIKTPPGLRTLLLIKETITTTENIEIQTVERVEKDLNNFLEAGTQTEKSFGTEGSLL